MMFLHHKVAQRATGPVNSMVDCGLHTVQLFLSVKYVSTLNSTNSSLVLLYFK